MAKDTPFDRARDFVEEKIDQTKDVLGESYSRAREQFDDVSEDVRRYVRDNPGTALAVALGAGFLFGFLVRGGDD